MHNALRRFLQSLGEILQFDSVEAQSISNWAEIAKGVQQSRDKATHPASRIYAADKHTTAVINKQKAVIAAQCAANMAQRFEQLLHFGVSFDLEVHLGPFLGHGQKAPANDSKEEAPTAVTRFWCLEAST